MPWSRIPPADDPTRVRQALGHGIRSIRLYRGWSQQQLENRSGLDQTIISRLETGRLVTVRLARVLLLIDAMGVDRIVLKSRDEGPTMQAFAPRFAAEDDLDALGPPWPHPLDRDRER
jgi:transcriptional regulator with XRE-family HTH domain